MENEQLHLIGRGACNTVWAQRTGEYAFKREDGSFQRDPLNDFNMHRRLLAASRPSHLRIPACHAFLGADDIWWRENLR